jgi:hypothetical protein
MIRGRILPKTQVEGVPKTQWDTKKDEVQDFCGLEDVLTDLKVHQLPPKLVFSVDNWDRNDVTLRSQVQGGGISVCLRLEGNQGYFPEAFE